MTPEIFMLWIAHMRRTRGWSGREIARQLGCGINQVKVWREKGAPTYVGLACTALVHALPIWTGPESNPVDAER